MKAPITVDELKEILWLHMLWLDGNAEGKRANLRSANLSWADLRSADLRSADLRSADLSSANLRSANLSWADLSSADLRSADLRSADLILIGQDIRGYLFYAYPNDDNVVIVCAGCRKFVGIQAAKLHWMNRHLEDRVLHEDCMSLIARCEHMAIVRGWQLEPQAETETEKEIAE